MAELFRSGADPTTLTVAELVSARDLEERMLNYVDDGLESRLGSADWDAIPDTVPNPLPAGDRSFLYSVNELILQRDRYSHDFLLLRSEIAQRAGT